MLHRLGMVIAISGLIPELLAVLESITAQRHAGFCPIFFTRAQHWLETEEFSSCAADAQGAILKASMSGVVFFPHSPAPSTWLSPAMLRIARNINKQMYFIGVAIFQCNAQAMLYLAGFYTETSSWKLLTCEPINHSGSSTINTRSFVYCITYSFHNGFQIYTATVNDGNRSLESLEPFRCFFVHEGENGCFSWAIDSIAVPLNSTKDITNVSWSPSGFHNYERL